VDRRRFLRAACALPALLLGDREALPAVPTDDELVSLGVREPVSSSVSADGWFIEYGQTIEKLERSVDKALFYRAGDVKFSAYYLARPYCKDVLLKDVGYFVVPDGHEGDVICEGMWSMGEALAKGKNATPADWYTPAIRGFASFLRAARRTYLGSIGDEQERAAARHESRDLVPALMGDELGKLILFDDLEDRTDLQGNEVQRRCGHWQRHESAWNKPGTVLGPFPESEETRERWFNAEKDLFGRTHKT
jgi:hypothetical protein